MLAIPDRHQVGNPHPALIQRCLALGELDPVEREPRQESRRLTDRLRETDRARIGVRYELGDTSAAALAAKYQISDYSVRMILRKAGIGPTRHHVARETSVRAVELRAESVSIRQIAEELDPSQTTMRLIVVSAARG